MSLNQDRLEEYNQLELLFDQLRQAGEVVCYNGIDSFATVGGVLGVLKFHQPLQSASGPPSLGYFTVLWEDSKIFVWPYELQPDNAEVEKRTTSLQLQRFLQKYGG